MNAAELRKAERLHRLSGRVCRLGQHMTKATSLCLPRYAPAEYPGPLQGGKEGPRLELTLTKEPMSAEGLTLY